VYVFVTTRTCVRVHVQIYTQKQTQTQTHTREHTPKYFIFCTLTHSWRQPERERERETHAMKFDKKNEQYTPSPFPPQTNDRERHTLTCRTAAANGQWTVVTASPTDS